MRRVLLGLALVLLSGCTLDTVRSKPLDAQAKAPGSPNITSSTPSSAHRPNKSPSSRASTSISR